MAPKKPSHILDYPPSASLSQGHEEEEEEEVPEESEEEEESELTHKTPQITNLSQRSIDQPGEEIYEEEEGSDTDDGNTRNSPTSSSFTIKPNVKKKNNHSIEPTNPTTKRVLNDAKSQKTSSKKTKVAKDHLTEEDKEGTTKKTGSSSGRVFSPADEIVVLGAMIDYKEQKGADPTADMADYFKFVNGRFSFEVTKTQMYDKVRGLKRKFITNRKKGQNFIPTKPLDQECFELSKRIWGGNNVTGNVGNSGSDHNDRVVGNGVDHTETVKIADAVLVTKKRAEGKSSEGKRKEKGEKKKGSRKKKNNKKKMDDGPKTAGEEGEPVTDEDVMKDKEDVGKDGEDVMKDQEVVGKDDEDVMKDKEDVGKDDEDVMKDKEDVGKDDEDVMKEKEDAGEDGELIMKDKEDVRINNENVGKDGEHNIRLKYPHLIASLSMDMLDSQRKLMMEAICLLAGEKARELDNCWKEMQIEEIEFHTQKLELMAENWRVLTDALKKKKR